MIIHVEGNPYLLAAAAKQLEDGGFGYTPLSFITRPDILNGNFGLRKYLHINTDTCVYSIDNMNVRTDKASFYKDLPQDWDYILQLCENNKGKEEKTAEGLLGISTNEWETLKADIISALSAAYQDDEPSEFDVVKDAAELSVAATFVLQRAKELDREGETDDNRDEVESHAMLLIAKTIRFLVEQGYYDYD